MIRSIVLACMLVLMSTVDVFAGHCYRQRSYNYCYPSYKQVQKVYYQPYEKVEIQLLLVQPQVYEVEPVVQVEKYDRVVEVREVERIRTEKQQRLVRSLEQLLLPVIVRKEKQQVIKKEYHY